MLFTPACSCCGALFCNSPKGRVVSRIRVQTCSECGTLHDRDINASGIYSRQVIAFWLQCPHPSGRGGCQMPSGFRDV
ncbi:zinc ribbon domain-containing protein [Cronobacter dublinensis]|uniref:zinc ribbon domain-containing protein n=1 Tax=Cronobacter dublinensis TaxID=413497 RepID=UPI003B51DB4C